MEGIKLGRCQCNEKEKERANDYTMNFHDFIITETSGNNVTLS